MIHCRSFLLANTSLAAGSRPLYPFGTDHRLAETAKELQIPPLRLNWNLVRVLTESSGDLSPDWRSAALSILDELRRNVLQNTDFSGDCYNSDLPAIGMECMLLPLWADYDFEDAMRRIEEYPNPNYSYEIHHRIARLLAPPRIPN